MVGEKQEGVTADGPGHAWGDRHVDGVDCAEFHKHTGMPELSKFCFNYAYVTVNKND